MELLDSCPKTFANRSFLVSHTITQTSLDAGKAAFVIRRSLILPEASSFPSADWLVPALTMPKFCACPSTLLKHQLGILQGYPITLSVYCNTFTSDFYCVNVFSNIIIIGMGLLCMLTMQDICSSACIMFLCTKRKFYERHSWDF